MDAPSFIHPSFIHPSDRPTDRSMGLEDGRPQSTDHDPRTTPPTDRSTRHDSQTTPSTATLASPRPRPRRATSLDDGDAGDDARGDDDDDAPRARGAANEERATQIAIGDRDARGGDEHERCVTTIRRRFDRARGTRMGWVADRARGSSGRTRAVWGARRLDARDDDRVDAWIENSRVCLSRCLRARVRATARGGTRCDDGRDRARRVERASECARMHACVHDSLVEGDGARRAR